MEQRRTKDSFIFMDLPSHMCTWIAHAVGGAILADSTISENEERLVPGLIQDLGGGKEIRQIIEGILDSGKFDSLTPLHVPSDLGEMIFRYILNICIVDRNLAPKEIHYLNDVGNALHLGAERKRKIFKQVIFQAKERFFHILAEQLNADERYWLAIMILKIIYADHHVHQKELPYFNNVVDLLADSDISISSVKQAATEKDLEEFGNVQMTEGLATWVLEYLLGIVMIDRDCAEDEVETIQNIANLLSYDNKKLEQLIAVAKTDYQSLFS